MGASLTQVKPQVKPQVASLLRGTVTWPGSLPPVQSTPIDLVTQLTSPAPPGLELSCEAPRVGFLTEQPPQPGGGTTAVPSLQRGNAAWRGHLRAGGWGPT